MHYAQKRGRPDISRRDDGAGCAEVEENGNVLGGAGVRERQLFRTECNGISLLTKKKSPPQDGHQIEHFYTQETSRCGCRTTNCISRS